VVDVLVVSPHLDDAVLSVGGLLASLDASDRSAAVVTLFAGRAPAGAPSAFVDELHARWGLGAEPVRGRRAEDDRALAIVGATPVHLDFADAVYRRADDGTPRYPDWPAVGGGRLRDEGPLVDAVAAALQRIVDDRQPGWVVGPLACGGHVDHVLARRALERIAGSLGAIGLAWYEDLPYTARVGTPPAAIVAGLRPQVVHLDAAAWRRKSEAVAAYPSQHATVFGDGFVDDRGRPTTDPDVVLGRHAVLVGGEAPAERLWVGPPPPSGQVSPPWSMWANSGAS
jgi:LmbE family N-acetylglucosaminyl deacetylase